jgi:hypothetical protein
VAESHAESFVSSFRHNPRRTAPPVRLGQREAFRCTSGWRRSAPASRFKAVPVLISSAVRLRKLRDLVIRLFRAVAESHALSFKRCAFFCTYPNRDGAPFKYLRTEIRNWSFRRNMLFLGNVGQNVRPAQTVAVSAPNKPRPANIASSVFQAQYVLSERAGSPEKRSAD